MPSAHFADVLTQRISAVGSPICVGLDPVLENLPPALDRAAPAHAIADFSLGVIDAVAGCAAAIKLQSACYERYGSRGLAALEDAAARARAAGLAVVLDAKRGDIGISAAHYAAAAHALGAHAVTVNGYLGPETIQPFLERGLGVFVLVRTSNPGSDAVQSHKLADGRTVAEMMADHVAELGRAHKGGCGRSDVGAVVGATKAADGAALRARMPEQFFLIPGYGAQGGTAADIRAMLAPDRGGVLVTASRSVIFAAPRAGEAWEAAVAAAAGRLAVEIAAALKPRD